ncbi:MAG: ribonuclease HIII [Bacilli bacterium]|nr:ribonuclease HIII [Bacilli bacterium]
MTITLKISENTKAKMIEYFEDKKRTKTPAYAIFQADEEDTVVTLYQSGKAVFQGVSADVDAAMWKQMEKHLNPLKSVEETRSDSKDKKEKVKEDINPIYYYSSTIGSDEVGTGDYFGPVVVTSAFVKKEDITYLENLGLKDSKKLTDEKILKIAPSIVERITYNSIILTNLEYNNRYSSDVNMNKIKAILHNKVLLNLTSQNNGYDYVVVDQFAKPFVYFNYLKGLKNVYRNITFMTKAEDKCLSVAAASVISRYIFIKEFDKISKELDINLPKGASDKVDEVGALVVRKYGFDKLKAIAKLNFKNTTKITDLIEKNNRD